MAKTNTGDPPRGQPRLIRLALAAVPALLYLAVTIPNAGRIVVDPTTRPPTYSIVDRPKQIAVLFGIAVIPVACISIPARSRALRAIGWLLLWALALLAFGKGL